MAQIEGQREREDRQHDIPYRQKRLDQRPQPNVARVRGRALTERRLPKSLIASAFTELLRLAV